MTTHSFRFAIASKPDNAPGATSLSQPHREKGGMAANSNHERAAFAKPPGAPGLAFETWDSTTHMQLRAPSFRLFSGERVGRQPTKPTKAPPLLTPLTRQPHASGANSASPSILNPP
jgi:hypothetical protein